jgi:hypothetical protein
MSETAADRVVREPVPDDTLLEFVSDTPSAGGRQRHLNG